MSYGSVPLFWRLKRSKYNLIGTKCNTCSSVFFPPKTLCPNCRRKGDIKDFQFSGNGEILSYTVIHSPPEGFENYTPYAIAIIRLDEGTNISGHVIRGSGEIQIGKRVRAVFRKVTEEGGSGVINYGIKFELVE